MPWKLSPPEFCFFAPIAVTSGAIERKDPGSSQDPGQVEAVDAGRMAPQRDAAVGGAARQAGWVLPRGRPARGANLVARAPS
jgi:hypothetical protein